MSGLSVIWWLVPFALAMGIGFLALFVWAARSGQYEDMETPAVRILFEPDLELQKAELQKPEEKKHAVSRKI